MKAQITVHVDVSGSDAFWSEVGAGFKSLGFQGEIRTSCVMLPTANAVPKMPKPSGIHYSKQDHDTSIYLTLCWIRETSRSTILRCNLHLFFMYILLAMCNDHTCWYYSGCTGYSPTVSVILNPTAFSSFGRCLAKQVRALCSARAFIHWYANQISHLMPAMDNEWIAWTSLTSFSESNITVGTKKRAAAWKPFWRWLKE